MAKAKKKAKPANTTNNIPEQNKAPVWYYAHDADNLSKVWDTVKIRAIKPMSKLKRWLVVEKI